MTQEEAIIAIIEKLLHQIKGGKIKPIQASYMRSVAATTGLSTEKDVGYFPSKIKTIMITYEEVDENNIRS